MCVLIHVYIYICSTCFRSKKNRATSEATTHFAPPAWRHLHSIFSRGFHHPTRLQGFNAALRRIPAMPEESQSLQTTKTDRQTESKNVQSISQNQILKQSNGHKSYGHWWPLPLKCPFWIIHKETQMCTAACRTMLVDSSASIPGLDSAASTYGTKRLSTCRPCFCRPINS